MDGKVWGKEDRQIIHATFCSPDSIVGLLQEEASGQFGSSQNPSNRWKLSVDVEDRGLKTQHGHMN
ncbi:hypothetical protein P3S68_000795 [Capsicum galapagoense]